MLEFAFVVNSKSGIMKRTYCKTFLFVIFCIYTLYKFQNYTNLPKHLKGRTAWECPLQFGPLLPKEHQLLIFTLSFSLSTSVISRCGYTCKKKVKFVYVLNISMNGIVYLLAVSKDLLWGLKTVNISTCISHPFASNKIFVFGSFTAQHGNGWIMNILENKVLAIKSNPKQFSWYKSKQ